MSKIYSGRPTGVSTRRMSQKELITILLRRRRRELIAQGAIADPACRAPRFKFCWYYGEKMGIVYADDRSLARSLIKAELGISRKKRLPIKVEITRQPNADSIPGPGPHPGGNNLRPSPR